MRRFPGLRICGVYSPPFRPLTVEEDTDIRARIRNAGADLLLVGISTPKQDQWMAAHQDIHPGRANRQPSGRSAAVLSTREREVLGMVAMGQSSGEIAAALVVARSTVESHVRHCLDKLGARNRAHAIAVALWRGEITLEVERAL
jgi:DNA-binding NarL/FixJ family response regulator